VGTLELSSEPSGAEIYLDGRPTGRMTPATLRDVPFGRDIELELRLRGHRAYRETIAWQGRREIVRRIALRRSN